MTENGCFFLRKIGLSVLSMCQFFFLIDRSNHLGYGQVKNKWANLIIVWSDWPKPDHLLLTTNTRIFPLIILALYVGLFGREAIFSLSLCLILPVSMKFSLSVFKNAHLFQSLFLDVCWFSVEIRRGISFSIPDLLPNYWGLCLHC